MTPAKIRPKSLTDIMENKLFKAILDRSQDIRELIDRITKNWDYDLDKRKPSPALDEEGIFVGTDLDMCTFLMALVSRGAVVQVPKYVRRRPKTESDNEYVLEGMKRYGKILGVVSNLATFSFNVLIRDMAVVKVGESGDETPGAYRTFMMTDFDGSWWPGCKELIFRPDAKENEFLTKNELWTGNKVAFKQFVAPQRWVSLYGQHYFVLKAALQRIKDECKFLKGEIDRCKTDGRKFPSSGDGPEHTHSKRVGPVTRVKIDSYQFEVDIPPFEGDYDAPEATSDDYLKSCYELRKKLTYTIAPRLRFIARCIELAFAMKLNKKNGTPEGDPNDFPSWIQNCSWKEIKIKRTVWNKLIFGQHEVGAVGYGIRYRRVTKTEEVNPESLKPTDIEVK